MCVLFTGRMGDSLPGVYGRNLEFRVEAEDQDYLFDEIGSGLKIRQYQREKKELLESWNYSTGWYFWVTSEDELGKEGDRTPVSMDLTR